MVLSKSYHILLRMSFWENETKYFFVSISCLKFFTDASLSYLFKMLFLNLPNFILQFIWNSHQQCNSSRKMQFYVLLIHFSWSFFFCSQILSRWAIFNKSEKMNYVKFKKDVKIRKMVAAVQAKNICKNFFTRPDKIV